MASLSTEKSKITGRPTGRRIQFVDGNRQRKSIRLGNVPAKAAQSILARVESLSAAAISQTSWDAETAAWVGKLDAMLYDKLAKVGLLPKRAEVEKATLGPFVANYIAGRSDVKGTTTESYRSVERNLVAYFGADKPLSAISAGDADDWRRWLASSEGLAENTIRRRCGFAKNFFRAAVRKKLLTDSPFADMKDLAVRANRARDYFVTREDAAKVLAACPDGEWRLIFALSRFGGLRCPSEHLSLRWQDIDWATGLMNVRSPKTQHHEGHESRQVPIFPELMPHLQAAWDAAPEGSEFVIGRYRGSDTNLRTSLEKIIIRAGLTPWPKLYQNLRATRATELAAEYPSHVAAEWLGHSTQVAQKHYWRVTDADVQKALTMVTGPVQNPVQSATEMAREEPSPDMVPVAISANNDQLPKCTTVQVDLLRLESESCCSLPLEGATSTVASGERAQAVVRAQRQAGEGQTRVRATNHPSPLMGGEQREYFLVAVDRSRNIADGLFGCVQRTTRNSPPVRKTARITAILPPLGTAVTMPHRFPQLVVA